MKAEDNNLHGKHFGHWLVLDKSVVTAKGEKKWLCRCDCGMEFDTSYNKLCYSNKQSCGCQKKKHSELLPSLLTHVDGTSVENIKSKKIPSDNTTGVRGVYFIKGKWMAKIVFQKKQYNLGIYETIEEAAEARREAEQILFDGAVTHYEKWKEKANENPDWAKENPVEILVEKKNGNELNVTFLPVIE